MKNYFSRIPDAVVSQIRAEARKEVLEQVKDSVSHMKFSCMDEVDSLLIPRKSVESVLDLLISFEDRDRETALKWDERLNTIDEV